jgi:type IV secretory pathway VirB2 component (pilin)
MNVSAQAELAGRRADNSEWMDHAVRVGLVSYGIVHLVLAWLTIQLVFGGGGGQASNQGALQQLAQNGLGRFFLYVAAAGFLALVVWQALEAAFGHRDEDGGKRVLKRLTSAAKVVIYGALGISSFKTASGSSSSKGGGTQSMTSKVMDLPAGQLLVGAIGLGVVVVAGVLAYRGWKEKFRSKLDVDGRTGKDGRAYVLFGKIGYIAKGVALAVVGLLFLYAAVTHDSSKSGGLDQALHKLLEQPFGSVMLVVIAIGFAGYGLFCFAWARHLDRS